MIERGQTSSLLAALVLVNVLILTPLWVRDGAVGPTWIALEAALVAGAISLLPVRRWSRIVAGGVAILVSILAVLELADATTRESLGRPLNLYLDVKLAGSVVNLLAGSLGPVAAWLALLGSALGLAGATWLLARALCSARASDAGLRPRLAGIVLVLAAVAGMSASVRAAIPAIAHRTAAPAAEVARQQVTHLGRMLGERERFAAELAGVPSAYGDRPGVLERLRGRDVILAFIESYGMSALDDPRYAPLVRPRLGELGARMADAGLHVATGTLVAPIQGGQSWLAHGSLLSGAWLENQLRYDLLLASDRHTLIDDFRAAGHRTVALMPAIRRAWPEGERLGYDEVLAHHDIPYAGPALNWVTMPDQFTWSYFQRSVRGSAGRVRPVFAEISLISSHAPWTPILPVLDDWDAIGDGAIFAPYEHAGEPPADLWRDEERVRRHYALAVDYAIDAMIGFAERYVDDRTLLIALGDHQPAPLITGDHASRAVPVHVISGDASLVRPFIDWGFEPGAVPPAGRASPRMDAFRHWFVQSFSAPPIRRMTATTARD